MIMGWHDSQIPQACKPTKKKCKLDIKHNFFKNL